MSRGPDAGTLLERRLVVTAANTGVQLTIAAADWKRWASATFVGARHRLTLVADDDAAFAAWIAGLEEADLPLRGHLVADLKLVRLSHANGRAQAEIEVLTVEER